jgi:hypothetical protein
MTQDFTGFTFVTDLYVGARADENADRHYCTPARSVLRDNVMAAHTLHATLELR